MINKRLQKTTILPLLSDMALLVFSFFIIMLILQQLLIKGVERPFYLETETYFDSMEYELNNDQKMILTGKVEEEYFDSVYTLFKNDQLKMLRIEGHTDDVQPKPDQSRKWTTNRELSLLRANTVSEIFQNIAENRGMKAGELNDFKSKLFPGGLGEFKPRVSGKIVPIDDSLFHLIDTLANISDTLKSLQNAIDRRFQYNRRIEIYPIQK